MADMNTPYPFHTLGQSLHRVLAFFSIAAFAFAALPALAQPKVMRIIVPYAAGGPIDATARLMAERVKDSLGPVIIENRPGGGGNIGVDAIAKAAPDEIGRAHV